tara:strand:- start:8116 stop:10383 length:2268 start_codon:yes stop_codon:yes gene_type:complete
MTQIPREFFKTSVGTRANALWQITKEPSKPVAIFNERDTNAKKWLKSIRDVVQSNLLFQQVYRDLLPPGIAKEDSRSTPRWWKWSDEQLDFEGRDIGEPEASISAHGIEAATTGGHWPKLILDDLISVKHKQSEPEMERAREWVRNHVYLMRPAELGLAYVNCTPWTFHDIYRMMLSDFEYKLYRRHALEMSDGTPSLAGDSIFPTKLTTTKLRSMYHRDPFTFNCLPASSRITLTDWTHKRIDEVQIGDSVVGFAPGKNVQKHLLQPTVVTGIASTTAPVYRYILEDGKSVCCTEDHKWYRKHNAGTGGRYTPLGSLRHKNGKTIIRVIDIADPSDLSPEETRSADWLAGLFDGEGCVTAGTSQKYSGTLSIVQSETRNPEICTALRHHLTHLKFSFSEVVNKASNCIQFNLLNGRKGRYRFLALCCPHAAHKIIPSLYCHQFGTRVKVISRELLGTQKVFALETETGNYIAEGYASANSQMMCHPQPGREMHFRADWKRHGTVDWSNPENPKFIINHKDYDPSIGWEGEGEPNPPIVVPLNQMTITGILDPAPSENTEKRQSPNARNGLLVEGLDAWGRRYILEAFAFRAGYRSVIDKLFELAQKWGFNTWMVEEVVFSNVYRHWIQDDQRIGGKHENEYLRCVAVEPGKRNKDTRIMDKAPGWQQGRYYLNEQGCEAFEQEFDEYPSGLTKDLLDAMGYDHKMHKPESARELSQRRLQDGGFGSGTKDPITGYLVPFVLFLGGVAQCFASFV